MFLNPLELKGYTSRGKDCFLIYPNTIYCTQTENVPIYLSARMTRVSICRLCKSSSTFFQDKHIDYRVIKLIYSLSEKMRNKIAKCLSWDLFRSADIEPQKLFFQFESSPSILLLRLAWSSFSYSSPCIKS